MLSQRQWMNDTRMKKGEGNSFLNDRYHMIPFVLKYKRFTHLDAFRKNRSPFFLLCVIISRNQDGKSSSPPATRLGNSFDTTKIHVFNCKHDKPIEKSTESEKFIFKQTHTKEISRKWIGLWVFVWDRWMVR